MNFRAVRFFLFSLILITASASHLGALHQKPPSPVLALASVEQIKIGGKDRMRYNYVVSNSDSFPDDLFAAAPDLPPCGTNTKASRTWVDFYDSTGKRLNGFCALGKSSDLNKIWFALELDQVPPSYVYIELNDRRTNTKYKSNLADTSL